MGHRLSKIYTRTGDQGQTGLGDGSRLSKDAARVEALGTVDELNAHLGLLLSEPLPTAIQQLLQEVQHDLFDLGSELAVPGYYALAEGKVKTLETALEQFNQVLPPLKEFILPGGNRPAALTHVARTVCRRAERRLVTLLHDSANTEGSEPPKDNLTLIPYLNRLSDLLFVIARTLNRDVASGLNQEILWQPKRP